MESGDLLDDSESFRNVQDCLTAHASDLRHDQIEKRGVAAKDEIGENPRLVLTHSGDMKLVAGIDKVLASNSPGSSHRLCTANMDGKMYLVMVPTEGNQKKSYVIMPTNGQQLPLDSITVPPSSTNAADLSEGLAIAHATLQAAATECALTSKTTNTDGASEATKAGPQSSGRPVPATPAAKLQPNSSPLVVKKPLGSNTALAPATRPSPQPAVTFVFADAEPPKRLPLTTSAGLRTKVALPKSVSTAKLAPKITTVYPPTRYLPVSAVAVSSGSSKVPVQILSKSADPVSSGKSPYPTQIFLNTAADKKKTASAPPAKSVIMALSALPSGPVSSSPNKSLLRLTSTPNQSLLHNETMPGIRSSNTFRIIKTSTTTFPRAPAVGLLSHMSSSAAKTEVKTEDRKGDLKAAGKAVADIKQFVQTQNPVLVRKSVQTSQTRDLVSAKKEPSIVNVTGAAVGLQTLRALPDLAPTNTITYAAAASSVGRVKTTSSSDASVKSDDNPPLTLKIDSIFSLAVNSDDQANSQSARDNCSWWSAQQEVKDGVSKRPGGGEGPAGTKPAAGGGDSSAKAGTGRNRRSSSKTHRREGSPEKPPPPVKRRRLKPRKRKENANGGSQGSSKRKSNSRAAPECTPCSVSLCRLLLDVRRSVNMKSPPSSVRMVLRCSRKLSEKLSAGTFKRSICGSASKKSKANEADHKKHEKGTDKRIRRPIAKKIGGDKLVLSTLGSGISGGGGTAARGTATKLSLISAPAAAPKTPLHSPPAPSKFVLLKIGGKSILVPLINDQLQPCAYLMNGDKKGSTKIVMTKAGSSPPTATRPAVVQGAQEQQTVLKTSDIGNLMSKPIMHFSNPKPDNIPWAQPSAISATGPVLKKISRPFAAALSGTAAQNSVNNQSAVPPIKIKQEPPDWTLGENSGSATPQNWTVVDSTAKKKLESPQLAPEAKFAPATAAAPKVVGQSAKGNGDSSAKLAVSIKKEPPDWTTDPNQAVASRLQPADDGSTSASETKPSSGRTTDGNSSAAISKWPASGAKPSSSSEEIANVPLKKIKEEPVDSIFESSSEERIRKLKELVQNKKEELELARKNLSFDSFLR